MSERSDRTSSAATPSGFLKENALLLADEHKARCDDPDCRVSLLGLWRLLEAAGFELTDDEKARLM